LCMTAEPEGQYADDNNDTLIKDQKLPSNIEDDPGAKQKDPNPGDPCLLPFIKQYGLSDVREQLLSSKLSLEHLQQVEKDDLEALCRDLKLSSSQKIRVKHAIKSLQKTNQSVSVHSEKDAPTHIEIKESRNGRLKRRMLAKVEQIFGNDVAIEAEGSSHEQKVSEDPIQKLRTKIVIVGEAAVGKTTLQKAIMGWQFEEGSKATFAVNSLHHKSRFKHNSSQIEVDYEIFDTPGLDRFRDIITLYLRGALAVIVVYDVSQPATFEKAKWWIDYLENHASNYDKIMLVANKIDIDVNDGDIDDNQHEEDGKEEVVEDPGCLIPGDSTAGKSEDVLITTLQSQRMYATEHGIAFLEVSAKFREHIDVLTSWINKQARGKVDRNPELLMEQDRNIKLHDPLLAGETEQGFMDRFDLNCC